MKACLLPAALVIALFANEDAGSINAAWHTHMLAPAWYKEMITSDESTSIANEILASVLTHHEAGKFLVTHDKWPQGLPLRVSLDFPIGMFPDVSEWYLVDVRGCHDVEVLRYMWIDARRGYDDPYLRPFGRLHWDDATREIPTTCIDETGTVQFKVRVASFEPETDDVTEFQNLSFEVELVDSINDVIVPVTDNALKAMLKESASPRIVAMDDMERKAVLTFRLPDNLPKNITIAFSIELTVNDDDEEQIVATTQFTTTQRYRRFEAFRKGAGSAIRLETDTELASLYNQVEGRDVRARFTSNPELALREFENTQYWEGNFTVDVHVSIPEPEE